MTTSTHTLYGAITSVGFASGDRFVIGDWQAGPIGPMLDVMWVDASGRRTLIATDDRVSAFVSAIYQFDDVVIDASLSSSTSKTGFCIVGSRLNIDALLGRTIAIPFRRFRTPNITRYIENPIAKRLMGVATYGVTNRGIREWYQADSYRKVIDAHGMLDGVTLGAMRPLAPALGVGFSEPPKQPSMVKVRPMLQDPTGRLDHVIKAHLQP